MVKTTLYITQEQYDRWIKNMSKNKTGTSWVYININPEYPNTRCKLFKDDEKKLYWIRGIEKVYLTIKEEKVEEEDESSVVCKSCKNTCGSYGCSNEECEDYDPTGIYGETERDIMKDMGD